MCNEKQSTTHISQFSCNNAHINVAQIRHTLGNHHYLSYPVASVMIQLYMNYKSTSCCCIFLLLSLLLLLPAAAATTTYYYYYNIL